MKDIQHSDFSITGALLKKEVIPVVKLGEPLTYAPWKFATIKGIVVRMHDLLTSSGRQFSPVFSEIEKAGGIQAGLDCPVPVLLSSVMSDKKIFNSTPEMYAHAIQRLKPDFFMTLDGETYLNEEYISKREVNRVLLESEKIIAQCSNSVPIGLIKGATISQLENSIESFQRLGINQFVFHTGDYLADGDTNSILAASTFIRHIRKKCANLLLYGIGSRRYFRKFFNADGFITMNHFINGFHRIKKIGGKEIRTHKKPTQEAIM